MKQKLVAPSMLSADFGELNKWIDIINGSNADIFHLDIMDGLFVPNISYGFPVIDAIAKRATKTLEAHLMIVDPDRYIERFAKLGINWLAVHYEACTHLHRTLQNIRENGMKAGIVLNPHTPVSLLEDIMPYTDIVVLMSVNPGFGGQKFIENTYSKLSRMNEMRNRLNPECLIEIDGGVNAENAVELYRLGADILVAGSAVFGAKDPLAIIDAMKK